MQTNGFFTKGRLIFLGTCALIGVAITITAYGRLAFAPKQERPVEVPAVERGSITDRNGKPLAVTTTFWHFGVTPSKVKNPAEFAAKVSPIVKTDESEIIRIIENAAAAGKRFVFIKRRLDQETRDILLDCLSQNEYTFVRLDPVPGRIYPENELASQLVGYMGVDGKGLAGIEYSMQSFLSPSPEKDQVVHGKNVYLTIDAGLQYKLQKIAEHALEETQAANIMVLAAYAKTGEILSYISLPSINLNEYSTADNEKVIDRPAMTFFEPGSVFKVFSIAAAYDAGLIRQDELFYCDGIYEKTMSSGEKVKITCLNNHGWQTARGALEVSCNDITAQITERLDTQNFLAKLRGFGFGQRTGVELPGESAGSIKDTTDKFWSARSKMTISIGQEVGVTALQMVQAATYIANGGTGLKLSLINKITDHEGNCEYQHLPEYKNQVVSPATAKYILSCMKTGAENGIGFRANLGDISIGVKTGTAQMPDPKGGYSDTDFLSDCLAFFPAENPEIILYIVIQKSQGVNYASRIVAPVIKECADTIIDYFGISRGKAASFEHSGKIRIKPAANIKMGSSLPDFTGASKRELLPLLSRDDIKFIISGNGQVIKQNPPAGTKITENMTIELYLE